MGFEGRDAFSSPLLGRREFARHLLTVFLEFPAENLKSFPFMSLVNIELFYVDLFLEGKACCF